MVSRRSGFYNTGINPLFCYRLGIGLGGSFIYVVLLAKQTGQVFGREGFVAHFLPQIGCRFVHADNLREVDVLNAFCHNDVFAADVAKAESFLYLHIFFLYSLFTIH